ncbi:glycosyltransferase family 2 protein [Cohnella silvisoli]|uniref:Glycosyltransferase family 2 protein n=1 Tax=Cohnella silvisoli TaxID=2873699 RepID=A0ABV1KUP0_9BACL|nr:glycosyltransferase family 2 protein [Cohnella silvisoli]MCD9022988.1 glycosyltransferase family 2 protein [Cohnella silvisoli]
MNTIPYSDRKEILIVVPAYNEAEGIVQVVAEIRGRLPEADVLVVNDGSSDRTGMLAEAAGALTVHLPANLGIGGAVQTGYKYAAEFGYRYAAQIDGDGQHDPADFNLLLEALQQTGVDMVVGSRFLENKGFQSTFARKIGIELLSKLVSGLLGKKVTDPTSGYRLCGRKAIELFSRDYPTDYPEVEALVLLDNSGSSFIEIPVVMKERQAGTSSISSFKSIYYMIKVVLAVLIAKSRKKKAWKMSYES